MDIFAKATKNKIRFEGFKGILSAEDLWDLSVQQLDRIYKLLAAEARREQEDSLLNQPTKANETLALKIEVVKFIVAFKLEEAEAKKVAAANAEKKRKVLDILARKQDASLEALSEEELTRMINEL